MTRHGFPSWNQTVDGLQLDAFFCIRRPRGYRRRRIRRWMQKIGSLISSVRKKDFELHGRSIENTLRYFCLERRSTHDKRIHTRTVITELLTYTIRAAAGTMSATIARSWRLRDVLLRASRLMKRFYIAIGICDLLLLGLTISTFSFLTHLVRLCPSTMGSGRLTGSQFRTSSTTRHYYCLWTMSICCVNEVVFSEVGRDPRHAIRVVTSRHRIIDKRNVDDSDRQKDRQDDDSNQEAYSVRIDVCHRENRIRKCTKKNPIHLSDALSTLVAFMTLRYPSISKEWSCPRQNQRSGTIDSEWLRGAIFHSWRHNITDLRTGKRSDIGSATMNRKWKTISLMVILLRYRWKVIDFNAIDGQMRKCEITDNVTLKDV